MMGPPPGIEPGMIGQTNCLKPFGYDGTYEHSIVIEIYSFIR